MGRHSGHLKANSDIHSRRVEHLLVRNFTASRPAKPVERSNRCRRWGSSLVNKGLAAFQPASVTLSLACLCRFPLGTVEMGRSALYLGDGDEWHEGWRVALR